MNNGTLLVLLLVSIIAVTAFVTIAVQRRFIGSVTIAAPSNEYVLMVNILHTIKSNGKISPIWQKSQTEVFRLKTSAKIS